MIDKTSFIKNPRKAITSVNRFLEQKDFVRKTS